MQNSRNRKESNEWLSKWGILDSDYSREKSNFAKSKIDMDYV
jgi:hypothetical protein